MVAEQEVAEFIRVKAGLGGVEKPFYGAVLDGLALVIVGFEIERDVFVAGVACGDV